MDFKLGKAPARKGAVRFQVKDYVDIAYLAKKLNLPSKFGHDDLIPTADWGMLGNDKVGDCVIAGAYHEHMLWNKIYGRTVHVTEGIALNTYSKITGYDPKRPETDAGTDMSAAAEYRRTTGIVDADGRTHRIFAYLAIPPGNIQAHLVALRLFGAVGIGLRLPTSAMDQLNEKKPWSVVRGSRTEGGHYVSITSKRPSLTCVTWGMLQAMTQGFLQEYNDESLAYISLDYIDTVKGTTPEGFDLASLASDLKKLAA